MVRKGHSPEQIINKLREAEIMLSQGATIAEASRKIGVTDHTYYRWRKEYGGMRVDQARRLKELELGAVYHVGYFHWSQLRDFWVIPGIIYLIAGVLFVLSWRLSRKLPNSKVGTK